MTSSRKHQLTVALILTCICIPTLAAEPNETTTEVKFETKREARRWLKRNGEPAKGPVKPTYVAELIVSQGVFWSEDKILKASAAQTISELQRNFLTSTIFDRVIIDDPIVQDCRQYHLYAVSVDDAKKMVQAFLEISIDETNKRMQRLQASREEVKEEIAKINKEKPEKEAELKAAQAKLDEAKKTGHYRSFDAVNKTISEMNKILDNLNIELAGMNAKRSAIMGHQERQKSIRDKKLDEGISREGILLKLEEMWIDLLIESKVAEAKKETATRIRKQAKDFNNLIEKVDGLEAAYSSLSATLKNATDELNRIEFGLAGPAPYLLAPKVYQNKVTIYPVFPDN
ncbi:MAG: hypothetical protein ACYS1A_10025 [Planctomycetota bacterium]|jgi:hypothetical protein